MSFKLWLLSLIISTLMPMILPRATTNKPASHQKQTSPKPSQFPYKPEN